MPPEHLLEPTQELGSRFDARHVGNAPFAPPRLAVVRVEPQEAEAPALGEIHHPTRLVSIEVHSEFRQHFQQPFPHGPLQPLPAALAVDQDHQVVSKSGVLDVLVPALPGDFPRPFRHPVHLVEVEIAEQQGDDFSNARGNFERRGRPSLHAERGRRADSMQSDGYRLIGSRLAPGFEPSAALPRSRCPRRIDPLSQPTATRNGPVRQLEGRSRTDSSAGTWPAYIAPARCGTESGSPARSRLRRPASGRIQKWYF